MSYTITFHDIEYPEMSEHDYCSIEIEVSPITTDESFDAHNGMGLLQVYGDSNACTGYEIHSAYVFYGEVDKQIDAETAIKLIGDDIILDVVVQKYNYER